MDDRANDAFGDFLSVFLQKEREKETQSKPGQLRRRTRGGRKSARESAIDGRRDRTHFEPRTPGWFLRFMLFFQIAMIYFAPLFVISAPSWSGTDVVTDKIETYLILPVMLVGQLLIFMATMVRAVSLGVFTLGYGVSTFLCSYYVCVFAYALSMGGFDDAGSRPPFLRGIGLSSETSMSVAVFSLYFGAFSLLVALALSFFDRPRRSRRPNELRGPKTALSEGPGMRRVRGRGKAALGVGAVGEGSA